MGSSELYEADFIEVVRETDKAVLFNFVSGGEVWVPKSIIGPIDYEAKTVPVPEWFCAKEGIE